MSKVMARTCDDYEPLFAEELAKYDQVKGDREQRLEPV